MAGSVLPSLAALDPGNAAPAYGTPLLPWFSLAWANLDRWATAATFAALGLVAGLCLRPVTAILATTALLIVPQLLLVATIVNDGLRDPTSHNLWPFEIVILAVVTAPAALGSVVGCGVRWVRARRR